MKKFLCVVVSLLVVTSLFAATNNEVDNVEEKEKPVVKFYGKVVEYTSGPMMTDALAEMLKDDYIIDAIQVDWGNQNTVIRTGIASGDPCDVYNFTPKDMVNFKDMALDLKPYLDADPEWKAQFNQSALDAGTYDGKILNVPWEQNFPVVLANKTILDEIGIVIPEAWTIEEFSVVAQKIKDAGYFPITNATDHNRSSWMFRNAMLSVVKSAGKAKEYSAGSLDIAGPEAVKALEEIKSLYDNNFMFPGEGAVTVKGDEVKAGFFSGEVLMMPEIASGAKQTSLKADFEVVLVPWPSAGSMPAKNGVYNGFFVPANAKNPDAAVTAIKAFTSKKIQAIHGAEGYLPANNMIEITDPFVKSILASAGTVGSEYPFSPELLEYLENGLIFDLILNGGTDTVINKISSLK